MTSTAPMSGVAPGWHGKLPIMGDFASRRLDPAFVAMWDGWVSAGLVALKEDASWPDAYLASPTWMFVMMPDALPQPWADRCWAGVLMPSVDSVGRYYPLSIVTALGAAPATAAHGEALLRWLQKLADAAADALHDDWSTEMLEAELARMGAAPGAAEAHGNTSSDESMVARCMSDAAQRWLAEVRGTSLWQSTADNEPARLLTSRGVPTPAFVRELLGTHVGASIKDDNA